MATRKMSLKELNELRGGTSNARKMTKSELEEYRKKGNSANVPLFTNETKTDIQDNEKRRSTAEKMLDSRGYIVSKGASDAKPTDAYINERDIRVRENYEAKQKEKVREATATVARTKRSNGLTTKEQREEAKEAQSVINTERKKDAKKNSISPVRALQGGMYLFERAATGAGGAIENVFKFTEGYTDYALSKVTGALGMNKVSETLKKTSQDALERGTFAEKSKAEADEAYKPSETLKYAGDLFESGGRLALPMLAEAATVGMSPWLEAELAASGLKFAGTSGALKTAAKGIKALSKTKAGKIVANMWKPSSVLFRADVTGSAASEAYRETGDIDKAVSYGYFTGLAESLTEQIFGGFAGTDIGTSLIDFKIGNTALRKTANILSEAVEEIMTAAADPGIKRMTGVDKDAKMPGLVEFAQAGAGGILLSALMGVATAKVGSKERTKAINSINTVTDGINKAIEGTGVKITPLSKYASVTEIEKRQQDIENFAKNYAKAGFAEMLEFGYIAEEKAQQSENSSKAKQSADIVTDTTAPIEASANSIEKKSSGVNYTDNTFEAEHAELKNTERPSVSVGDTFTDTELGNTITVVERDNENTTIRIDSETKSKTETLKNRQADMLIVDERYKQIESGKTVDSSASNQNTAEIVTSDKNTVSNHGVTTTNGNSEAVDVQKAQKYNIVVSNLKRKADELGLMDRSFQVALQNVHAFNPTAEDKALISREFNRIFAGNTDPLVANWLDSINAEVQPVTSINEQNMHVNTENNPVNDAVTNTDGDKEFAVILDAVNETLYPKAKLDILKIAKKNSTENGIEFFAENLKTEYEQKGTIERFSGYFSDGGKKVVSVLGGSTASAKKTDVAKATESVIETSEKNTDDYRSRIRNAVEKSLYPQFKEDNTKGLIEKQFGDLTDYVINEYQKNGDIGDLAKTLFADNGEAVTQAVIDENSRNREVGEDIDERTFDSVGSKNVKAYQYLYPQLKKYYRDTARQLITELHDTVKGERFSVSDSENSRQFSGTKRIASESISRIKDSTDASYANIEDALNRIINDNGQENVALAKRIELVIDDMLSEGYTAFDGTKVPADMNYITEKEKITVSKNTERESDVSRDNDIANSGVRTDAENSIEEPATNETKSASEYNGTETYASGNGYVLTNNAKDKVISIKFNEKPSIEVRTALKNNAFVWSKTKGEWTRSGGWYDKNSITDIMASLDKAYETKPTEESTKVAEETPSAEIQSAKPTSEEIQEETHTPKIKEDFKVGDVLEVDGEQWKCVEIDSMMIDFVNVDKNAFQQNMSVILPYELFKEKTDYKVVSKNTTPDAPAKTEKNVVEKATKNEDVLKNEPNNAIMKSEGTKQIADYIATKLAKGEKITALELSKISSDAFGGSMADNAYSIKDAYDAMELGVNKHILSMKDVSTEKMLEILELLPTQTKRTEDMIKYQQFSTPPSIAYLANYVANINSNDIMLEPSAGIGGIALFAKKDGATVYVNELDERRLSILKNMPFDGFFNENAEQLDNILGGEIEPTVIVMNPPFSSSSERNIQNTKIGAKHIEQALKILAPNGRLVAIVGHGMGDGAPAFRNWWKDIKSQYNVRANIRINGKNYNKYGTNFDIQMLVIDKNGATTHTETGYVDTLQELQEKLGGIRDERPAIDYSANEQRTPRTTRTEIVTTGKTSSVGNRTVSDAGSITDKGKSADNANLERQPERKGIQSVDADDRRTYNQAPEIANGVVEGQLVDGRGELRGNTELQNDGRTSISDSRQHSEQSNVDRSDRDVRTRQNNVRIQRPKRTELTDSIFEHYQTQPLRLNNTQPHPAKVSESAAMSAIEPPAVTYKPNIPQSIVENGVLSDVQLEAISYAGQSHSQTLPNGNTRGFFLGDGTGIGKGRTIAGMILDNYNQGRKKSLWVTLNASLVNDAKRDVKALFGDSDLVTQFVGGNKADSVLSTDEAIMVISYSALSKGFDNSDSNFEKIVKWLGKDFDGLIVFDEAHKMGNAKATKGTRGIKKASQTGLAGIALQEALPKAKIVYSSATGATEVENLRYAERLGLWGEGTAFVTGDDFVSKIKAGGLAAMELIARDMKAMGVYLSRNISYEDVRYDKITHKLTGQQKKIYDELARSWQIVLNNINKALDTTNQSKDGTARGRALGAFWSSQQRFFNQILTSMQVPSVIADIEKQLSDGKSCVIQLVSTNEAAQNEEFARLKAEDLELDEFDLTPKQMLMSYIENSFPVQQFEEYRDDEGNVRSKPVYDSKGNPVMNREAVKQREDLLAKLGSIKVPSSPIDMIINHFGTDLVAENTGRARRVIQKDGKFIEEKIGSKKDADVDAFQNGNKRIIIFSKAGGTGKSYHADRAAKNQQQRVHYLLEAGWQADNAVQGFGRSHRSNQASAPIFKLVTTDLKGQMRFISTIAKRLDQLGAMTKGQRQAGGQGMFSASDNLENSFAADVLAVFYKDLVANKVDGIDDGLAIVEKLGLKDKILDDYNSIIVTAPELREVNKFLNRILSLESSEQNTVFDGYSERLQDATEKAMLAGVLDKGLENYKADKITLNEVFDIREDERSGAKTKYYNLTAEHKIKPAIFKDVPTESKSFVGFYQNKTTGVVRAVMQTSSTTDQYGNVTNNYKLIGPIKNDYIPQNRFYGNWSEINASDAENLWNEEVLKFPKFRKESLHLISGVVLPVWDKLPSENVRIYRVLTSDGEMLIGRVVSEDMIDKTLRQLGFSRTKEKIETKDLVAGIKNGDTVYLENDWKIVQRKVSGENRIELVGPSYEHYDLLTKKGVFTERIQYNTRYFIPADTDTVKIIDDILKLSPVMRVENVKYSVFESEDNYDERKNLLSDGSGERTYSTSSGRQIKRMDGRSRRYKEGRRASYERRKYCQTLKASGNTRQKIIYGHRCEVISKEDYTSRMSKIAEQNKKNGFDDTIFVTGKIEIPFIKDENGNSKKSKGVHIEVDGKKIVVVQYDNEYYLPEQINDHEMIHDKYDTPLVQKVKNIIKNSLTVAEKKQVLEKLSKDYSGIIDDNEEDLIQEFVANILSDMDYEYFGVFSELQKAYWKGDEQFIDNYKVSEYTESTDAGGINTHVLDNIGFGNDFRLSDGIEDIPYNEYMQLREYIAKKNNQSEELLSMDYKEVGNNFYIWRNIDKMDFNVTESIPIIGNEDIIGIAREVFVDETYRGADTVREWIDSVRNRKRSSTLSDSRTERATAYGSDDRLSRGQSDGDTGGYSAEGSRVEKTPLKKNIHYSVSLEDDIAELTPERKKEIFEQFNKDRAGVDKPTQKQLWGERAAWIAHNMTRVFPNIPERGEKGTFFAEFRKSMIQWKNLPSTTSFMVQDKLNKMTEGLTPEEFKTFSELVYFLDLQEEAQIQRDKGYTEILLPNEITPSEVDAIVKVLNEEATENVQQALIKRQNIWETLKSQYIDLNRYIGFDTDGKFKRKNYYHHQVIEYMNNGVKGTGNREIGIKAGRGWLKERQGSTKAINTDFLAVEYKAMLQMQYDVYIAETLGRIKQQYDIKPQLENEAFKNNKDAINEIIRKEATSKDGNIILDSKGKPDSETYRQQQWYNSRIMFGFDGLFDLAERNELPTYDGEYARVVEALRRNELNVPGLYKYIGIVASTDLPNNATDAQEQAVLSARTVLKYTSQKRTWIKEKLGDNYQTWETIAKSMSNTHSIHQPRRGNYFYTKTVIDEDAFNKAHNEMVLALASGEIDLGDVDLNKLFTQYADTVRLTGAAYEQWVLPNEIVTTMDEIANPKQANVVSQLSRTMLSAWKGWATSVNPFRTVKFGLRNLYGDLDAVIAGNPKVTMYAKKAVQDIYQAMRHKKYSDDFIEWVERGGYTSMIFANEMDSEMQDKLFSHLKEKQGVSIFKIPLKWFEKYQNGVESVHNFREAILRYSSYLYFKEEIKKNGGKVKDYVASNKYIVRGLNSVEDKAYQLSKDLLGAYDEVGRMGQAIRRHAIPFYSFTETNLKRYYRLFENIITSDNNIPKKAGKLLLKALMVNMLGLLMVAWNKLVMKDEDDKLPPSVRNVPHLTLCKIGDNVYAFRQLGSFSEILEWFGLEDYKWSSEDLIAPLDKAWGMVTPFMKLPIELVSGLNFYPSLTQPRAIRDKWQHFFNSFGVDDLYNEVTGKPTKGAGEILKGSVVYNYDYKESAYYEILDIKRKYQDKTDNTIYGTDAKSNALYYMKKAIRYKDKEAALKYLDEYFKNGGTVKGIKQSFATLNPMYGFTSKETAQKGKAFVASLTEDEKEKLKIAQEYYENDLMLPENVLDKLGRNDITDEEAKNVLRNYIDAKCK